LNNHWWERFIQLGHFSPDCRFFLNQIDFNPLLAKSSAAECRRRRHQPQVLLPKYRRVLWGGFCIFSGDDITDPIRVLLILVQPNIFKPNRRRVPAAE
jgi:hypothetical protein